MHGQAMRSYFNIFITSSHLLALAGPHGENKLAPVTKLESDERNFTAHKSGM